MGEIALNTSRSPTTIKATPKLSGLRVPRIFVCRYL
jgi:hypothetical protein